MARIIFIEGDMTESNRVRRSLVAAGYEVSCAGDMSSAQAIMTGSRYDVEIWNDSIVCNRRDGFEQAVRRKVEDETRNIIVLTADNATLATAQVYNIPCLPKEQAGVRLTKMIDELLGTTTGEGDA